MRTVLAQPTDHPRDRAVRWRQLVELLARGGDSGDPALINQAIAEIERDSLLVDEQVRTAAARAIAALAAPPELVRIFAADRLNVAAPVLAAARLTASDWARVAAGASPECRRFIASLRSDVPAEIPAPAEIPVPAEPAAAAPAPPEAAIPSISEVVARIERLRQTRQQPESEPESEAAPPVPEPPKPPQLFRWECDAAGDIAWVDAVPRGAIIGRSIARGGEGGDIDRSVERAFALKLPFSDARLELAEGSIVGGSWKISGMPAFDPASGRFTGYRGIAQRDVALEQPLFGNRDPDALRELVHELKTPLNAIIGFAEIINGQYLGPAESPYRERAGEIVVQARLLLTAIDDLDLAARLQAGPRIARATDLADVIAGIADDLARIGASFEHSAPAATSLDAALGGRLVSRFCEAVIGMSGEPQTFNIGADAEHCVLSARTSAAGTSPEASLALRLVIGLARVAGGSLEIGRDQIKLMLPRA